MSKAQHLGFRVSGLGLGLGGMLCRRHPIRRSPGTHRFGAWAVGNVAS